MKVPEWLRRATLRHRESVAGTVYGTIVVMATIAAGSRGDGTTPWKLATVVAVTTFVLWIAHVYSHGLAEGLRIGRHLTARELTGVARREISILEAAIGPVLVLGAAELELIEAQAAVRLALAVGIATLAFQGARYAALEHMGRLGWAISVLLNVGLGLAIVLLEVAITH
jgi:hypothetical protein